MNEIANYIVNELKWYAVKLCRGDRFMADDLIQNTALRCIQYYIYKTDISLAQQKNTARLMMQSMYLNMRKTDKTRNAAKYINGVLYWFTESEMIEYEKNIEGIMRFVKQSNKPYMESFILFLHGYRTSKIAVAKKVSVNSITGDFSNARKNIRKHFKIKVA